MSALICFLVLLAPEPADEVLQAFKEGKDLKALASRDDPDPWIVADELCARGEHDAAEAFAKAAPRKATERLAQYIASRRGMTDDAALRAALAEFQAKGDQNSWPELWKHAAVTQDEVRSVLATLVAADVFAKRRRFQSSEKLCLQAAEAAERIGWWRRAAEGFDRASWSGFRRTSYRTALESAKRTLQMAECMEDRALVARTVGNLGAIYDATGDLRHALELQDRAARLKEEVGDYVGLATTLRLLGDCHRKAGAHAQALECYKRALSLSRERGLRPEETGALVAMGVLHNRAGDHAAALEDLERARAICAEIGSRRGEASALGNMGNAYSSVGDYPRAVECYERALKIAEEENDLAGISAGLGNLGSIHLKTGSFPRALQLFERALRLEEEAGDRANGAVALLNIGTVLRQQGSYARALACMERAVTVFEEVDDRWRIAQSLTVIGTTHGLLGSYDRSLECFERALALSEEIGDRAGAARALGHAGDAHRLRGDCAAALRILERALRLTEELGDRPNLAGVLDRIGDSWWQMGDYVKALEYGERVLKLEEELGDEDGVAIALTKIANTHWSLGDFASALETWERALALCRRLGSQAGVVHSLLGVAENRLELGRPADAIGPAREAVEAMGLLTRGLTEEESAFVRENFADLFQIGARAAARLGNASETAFFLESGRASALVEMLGGRIRLWAAAIPEPLRDEEIAARSAESVASHLYRKALESGGEIEPLWKRVEAARRQLFEVTARIQREAKAQAALLYPKADSLEEIQKSLRPDEALVLYGPKVALVVTPKDARIVEFGDLAKATEAFQKAVGRPDERGMAAPPHEQLPFLKKRLSALVVDALGLADSVKRLLVCPDGNLAYVPFCTLTEREVVYVPSGTVYRLLRGEESKRGSKVLALGDPKTRADPLPASGAEAKAVGDVVLLQEKATISGLRELLSTQERWHAVHFACHGLVDPERPVLSALALTPEGEEDGFLRCLDIYRMKIPADLVMLSACETAKGKVYKTEGVMGWTRAFMFAGAPRVIVSLWKVDDEATRALMEFLYENWKTMPAGTALRRAQEQVASQEKWKHPYFWAAWQLWGLAE